MEAIKIKSNKLDKKIVLGALAIMLAVLLWSLDGTFIRPKLYVLPTSLVFFEEHFFGFLVLTPFLFLGNFGDYGAYFLALWIISVRN